MSWLPLSGPGRAAPRRGSRGAGAGRSRAAWRDASGNVTILFALSLIPLIGLVGLGIDYGMALSAKTKLDNAADAAAIAAVATAKAYVAANPNDTNLTADATAAGQARALTAFAVNAGSVSFTATPTPTVNVTRSGQTFSSTVQYSTTSRNNFGQLFNQKTTPITGNTGAVADIPSYLDFYLLIDVSASMGLPSTSSGQSALAASTSANCQFACHFPDQNQNYVYAINNNIQLRSGAVNSAVCSLLNLAAQPSVPNQYRVGLYPFITQMGTLAPITSNIAALQVTATCTGANPTIFTSLLDTGTSQLQVNNDPTTGTGSGGTHFETTLATMQTTVSPYGDGSSAKKSKPFVFLITDGMENTQQFAQQTTCMWPPIMFQPYRYSGGSSTNCQNFKAYWSGTNPQTIDPSGCASMKSQGATISILYIPYTIGNFQNADTWETTLAQNVIGGSPSLLTQLQACATTGYFYTANTPADINTALAAMFSQAVQVAHLIR